MKTSRVTGVVQLLGLSGGRVQARWFRRISVGFGGFAKKSSNNWVPERADVQATCWFEERNGPIVSANTGLLQWTQPVNSRRTGLNWHGTT